VWLFGHLNGRQFACVAADPIRNGLRTNFQYSADRSLAAFFHIHLTFGAPKMRVSEEYPCGCGSGV